MGSLGDIIDYLTTPSAPIVVDIPTSGPGAPGQNNSITGQPVGSSSVNNGSANNGVAQGSSATGQSGGSTPFSQIVNGINNPSVNAQAGNLISNLTEFVTQNPGISLLLGTLLFVLVANNGSLGLGNLFGGETKKSKTKYE